MNELAKLASTPCADHAALGVLVARELGRPDGAWVGGRLRALARGLRSHDDPAAELRALGELLARRVRPRPAGALLLPDVLATAGGHPAGVAVAGAGIAAHAQVAIGLVGNGRRLYLAHEELDGPFVLDPAAPERLLDARRLGCDLCWRCAHESALAVLDHAAQRAERELDLPAAMACAALRLMLPLDDAARDRAQAEHLRLLAQLN